MRSERAAMLVCVLGGALRVAGWSAGRSLWLDEAMLGLNVVARSFVRLLSPLDNSQSAPWAFLWLERAAMLTFGAGERSLRLVALIAGLALPWVVWRLASRLFDEWTGVLAAALVALSPLLVYYANELKPYGPDALVATMLLLAATRVFNDSASTRTWFVLIALGVVALWSSFPALFVLGAIGVALVVDARTRGLRGPIAIAAVAWGAAFALPYFAVMRRAAHDDFLQSFFANRFIVPWESGAPAHAARAWSELALETFGGRFAFAAPSIVRLALVIALGALCVCGVRAAMRRGSASTAILLAGPMVLALAASAVRRYPVSPRLWSFAAPLWAMLIAATVVGLARRARTANGAWRAVSIAATIAVVAALLLSVADDVDAVQRPFARREHLRPLIEVLRDEQARTHEPMYVANRAAPHWLFYTTDWRSDVLPPIAFDSAEHWLDARGCTSVDRARPCQILGRRSGATFVEGAGFTGRADDAWAESEIARLRAAATPCGWVMLFLSYPGEPAALANAIARQRGTVERSLADRADDDGRAAARAFRVCFAA